MVSSIVCWLLVANLVEPTHPVLVIKEEPNKLLIASELALTNSSLVDNSSPIPNTVRYGVYLKNTSAKSIQARVEWITEDGGSLFVGTKTVESGKSINFGNIRVPSKIMISSIRLNFDGKEFGLLEKLEISVTGDVFIEIDGTRIPKPPTIVAK